MKKHHVRRNISENIKEDFLSALQLLPINHAVDVSLYGKADIKLITVRLGSS